MILATDTKRTNCNLDVRKDKNGQSFMTNLKIKENRSRKEKP